MRPVFDWLIGSRTLQLGKRTLIMGVVNVTPDSFSDGGVNIDRGRAVEYAIQLLHDGADIIDVGGESTRPGAKVLAVESGVGGTDKEGVEDIASGAGHCVAGEARAARSYGGGSARRDETGAHGDRSWLWFRQEP